MLERAEFFAYARRDATRDAPAMMRLWRYAAGSYCAMRVLTIAPRALRLGLLIVSSPFTSLPSYVHSPSHTTISPPPMLIYHHLRYRMSRRSSAHIENSRGAVNREFFLIFRCLAAIVIFVTLLLMPPADCQPCHAATCSFRSSMPFHLPRIIFHVC